MYGIVHDDTDAQRKPVSATLFRLVDIEIPLLSSGDPPSLSFRTNHRNGKLVSAEAGEHVALAKGLLQDSSRVHECSVFLAWDRT